MEYALPSGVINTDSVYVYADATLALGPLVKELGDQTLVIVDYSLLTPAHPVSGYDFTLDVTSNPQLVVSYPQLNPQGNLLTFLLSGGVTGQQYSLSIRATIDINSRTDVLTINIPSSSGDCVQINPVPQIYTQISLGDPTQGYVNTGVRYFWGSAPPTNPNVMDQWYTPDTDTLSEWVTDGVNYFWSVIMSAGFVSDAPTDSTIYGRYNGFWVAEPIQNDAPADGNMYVRLDNDWSLIPDFLLDAPIDDQYYSRFNGAWHIPPGGMLDAPSDSTVYARYNSTWVHLDHTDITDWDTTLAPYALISYIPLGSTTVPLMNGTAAVGNAATWARANHVHPTDTSLYPASNPAGYQTAAQVTAALGNYLPLTGGTLTGILTLVGNPVGNLDAATKQYADNAAANANIDCGTY